jgi:hypothetical protein
MSKSSDSKQVLPSILEIILRRVEKLPAQLFVKHLAKEFDRSENLIRKQIERNRFPLRVQKGLGRPFVALADYVKFLSDGEVQSQIVSQPAKRKVGRPPNSSKFSGGRDD